VLVLYVGVGGVGGVGGGVVVCFCSMK
jgi:hypothetical protein